MEERSSQKELMPSRECVYDSDGEDCYQVSTQEANAIVPTQEAIDASLFLESLEFKSSQESNNGSQYTKIKEVMVEPEVEKKKRGRKRKMRTNEEMVKHLLEKKEKNRLAAARLRRRKVSEVSEYEEERERLEQSVKCKKNFVQHLTTKVDQLRERIRKLSEKGSKQMFQLKFVH